MPKRKADEIEDEELRDKGGGRKAAHEDDLRSGGEVAGGGAHQVDVDETRLRGKLHHGVKEAHRAAKTAKTYEVQKVVKRLKQLRNQKDKQEASMQANDFDGQLHALKTIKLDSVAARALLSKLKKSRLLVNHAVLQSAVAADPLLSSAQTPSLPNESSSSPETKAVNRLLSSKVLADEVGRVVDSLRGILEPREEEHSEDGGDGMGADVEDDEDANGRRSSSEESEEESSAKDGDEGTEPGVADWSSDGGSGEDAGLDEDENMDAMVVGSSDESEEESSVPGDFQSLEDGSEGQVDDEEDDGGNSSADGSAAALLAAQEARLAPPSDSDSSSEQSDNESGPSLPYGSRATPPVDDLSGDDDDGDFDWPEPGPSTSESDGEGDRSVKRIKSADNEAPVTKIRSSGKETKTPSSTLKEKVNASAEDGQKAAKSKGKTKAVAKSEPTSSKQKKAPKATSASSGSSMFLPSLSAGFVPGDPGDWSEGDEKALDGGPPQRKNRMGQRARKALWEKKYGRNANHLKLREKDRRGAKGQTADRRGDARASGPANRRFDGPGWRKGDDGHGDRTGQRAPQGGAVPQAGGDDGGRGTHDRRGVAAPDKPVHASWKAKMEQRKREEAQMAAKPQGKKIVFD